MHLLRNIVGFHFFSKAPSEFGANLTKVKVLSSVKHATELFINMKRGTVVNCRSVLQHERERSKQRK